MRCRSGFWLAFLAVLIVASILASISGCGPKYGHPYQRQSHPFALVIRNRGPRQLLVSDTIRPNYLHKPSSHYLGPGDRITITVMDVPEEIVVVWAGGGATLTRSKHYEKEAAGVVVWVQ